MSASDSIPLRRYRDPLAGLPVALGVSGSIAAYKALSLASALTQAGALVDTLLTPAATRLVQPLAFQALTHRKVTHALWDSASEMAMDHVAVAHRICAFVIAPATADLLARLALGLADDAVTTTALATVAPLLVAPAMEPQMWAHPATQAHVAVLEARGATFIGPRPGRMASGLEGLGRMAEPVEVIDALRLRLGRSGPLAGRHVVVGSGPTREPIDPVRFLSNASSGHMGLALCRALLHAGARVSLVTGPVALPPPMGAEVVAVETAQQMCGAILDLAPAADALLMAAAVADYRPLTVSGHKIKKSEGDSILPLTRTPDILASLDRHLAGRPGPRPYRVGFAAETGDLEAYARDKLQRKGLDLVVANRVPESFGMGRHQAILVGAHDAEPIAAESKDAMAQAIVERVIVALNDRQSPPAP
ncbi:MAG: bifunctional phosphopantothenoylcysteine decarboxylase/phosphopantothenate--cysteine ligase CoaBC [Ardenticatenia bacterium]|nr:bifunctional phosphopantothenoylcysteine decarboxylase/phosphopantothenate--cysteine ligase CoaBC [Ardenticatenia bacterium]